MAVAMPPLTVSLKPSGVEIDADGLCRVFAYTALSLKVVVSGAPKPHEYGCITLKMAYADDDSLVVGARISGNDAQPLQSAGYMNRQSYKLSLTLSDPSSSEHPPNHVKHKIHNKMKAAFVLLAVQVSTGVVLGKSIPFFVFSTAPSAAKRGYDNSNGSFVAVGEDEVMDTLLCYMTDKRHAVGEKQCRGETEKEAKRAKLMTCARDAVDRLKEVCSAVRDVQASFAALEKESNP